MPSAELYRRHAATCHRLARAHSDKQWTGSLVRLAYEYEAKAAEIDGRLATDARPAARPGRPVHRRTSSQYVQG
jgi:hypothetical protein